MDIKTKPNIKDDQRVKKAIVGSIIRTIVDRVMVR